MGLLYDLTMMLVTLGAAAQPNTGGASQVTLRVGQEMRQTLEGFGCSLVNLDNAKIPDRERAQMFDRVFRDLGMNVLRLWVGAASGATTESMKAHIYTHYVDSGVIDEAQKHGVTTLLLAPASRHVAPSRPMSQYSKKLADLILALRTERQIRINVTGLNNEPGGFTPEQMADGVRLLRADLDTCGLQDVTIIAPESASADASGMKQIQGMRADPAAWAALRGIATHSYNMAATPEFAATIAGTNKEYWMTEASDNGNEGPADANRASTTAARFLNDLNHGVTHWIYFIGFDVSSDVATDRDNATKLMVFDRKSNAIFTHLKYDWFRQLRAAFPNGAKIHPLVADPGGELTYTYGQKPYLNAAAALRSDGGWSLGAVNLTGAGPDVKIRKFHPATELAVTWEVPELAAVGPVSFAVFRSDAVQRFVPDGHLTMLGGKLRLTIRPRELVTLQSRRVPVPPVDSRRTDNATQ